MSTLLEQVKGFSLDEGYSPKEIKMAIGIASDPRYKGGNMTGAVTAIDKVKKGLSNHPKVAAVLKRQNEDIEEAVSPAQQAAIAISKKEKAKEEGVELDEYLTPDEKKLIAKMYDKKGNLTPLGKKVMDYKIKKEEVELDEAKLNSKKIIADLEKGLSIDAIVGNHIDKRSSNKDEILKVIKDYKFSNFKKTGKKEEVENTEEGFSSDAQRRAAFASGYKEKDKKDKKEGNAFGMALKSAKDKGDKTFVVSGKTYNVEDYNVKEGLDIEDESDYTLDEGKMKDLHGYISTGKSAEEIAKIMKIDVKTVKTLMNDYKADEAMSPKAKAAAAYKSRMDKKFAPGGSYQKGADAIRKMIDKDIAKRNKKEDVKVTEGYFDEQKSSTGYDLYHKDFSGAMQHAYAHAKKKLGITIDPDEISDKVATGPSKPSKGKTNSYRLKGDKGSVQIQVYNMGSKFELNMYKESIDEDVDLDEAISGDQYYYVDPKGVVAAVGSKDAMRKMNMKQAKDGNKGGSFSQNLKKYKVGDKIKEEVEIDEGKNKPVSQMTPKERAADAARRKEYKDFQKSKRGEEVEIDEKAPKIGVDRLKQQRDKDKAHSDAMGRHVKSGRRKSTKEEVELDEVSKEGTMRVIDLARQNNPEVRKHLNVANAGNKGYQVQRMTKGKFVNQGKPYSKLKDAQKVQQGGQHSMQFETIDESVKLGGMPAGLSKERIKADRDVYAQVLGIKEALDPADFDISATSKDKDNATKNIILQLRKVISLNGKNPVEFSSGKKEKVHPNVAAAALSKFEKLRRTDQKDEFQQKIAKSYKDLLNAVKGK